MSKTFSAHDAASHNQPDSLYVIIDNDVYDLTRFQGEHPGGKKILQRMAGKDVSKKFWKHHNEDILKQYKSQLQIGGLDTNNIEAPPPPTQPAIDEKVVALFGVLFKDVLQRVFTSPPEVKGALKQSPKLVCGFFKINAHY